jgi:hypothetical protein
MQDEQNRAVARREDPAEAAVIGAVLRLPEADRRALLAWANRLLELRASRGGALKKALQALRVDDAARALAPLLRATGTLAAGLAWRDRSWEARLGVGAAGLTVAAIGGVGAGAAAAGAAVGLPLWIVLGTGDGFATRLAAEVERSLVAQPTPPRPALPDDGPVVEAEWEFASGPSSATAPAREPLLNVFQRAYRRARERQQAMEGQELIEPGE